jgi:hypothetical protein
VPEKNKLGRIIAGTWRYTEPDASRVKQAYDLLFERRGWHDIAERIGGGFTYTGVSYTLRNPIWRGARVFASPDGPFERQVIAEPLLSPERWQQAQSIIQAKRTHWLQTRRAEPPPFLCLGVARCACGKALYSKHKPAASYYSCQSRLKRYGPSCGRRTIRRDALDIGVERLFTAELLDLAFLVPLIRAAIRQTAAAQPDRSRERERLESKRRRVLDNYEDGYTSRAERDEKLRKLDGELASFAPAAPTVAIDAETLAHAIVRIFAGFAKLPFKRRRELLRATVREVVVDANAITGLTLAGTLFDASGTKSCKPSK